MLSSWRGGGGVFGRSSSGGTWNGIPCSLMWFLWKERNAYCFDEQGLSVAKLKYLLLKSLFEWIQCLRCPLSQGF